MKYKNTSETNVVVKINQDFIIIKPSEVKELPFETELNGLEFYEEENELDLNKDGKVDIKDKEIAQKVIKEAKKIKKKLK